MAAAADDAAAAAALAAIPPDRGGVALAPDPTAAGLIANVQDIAALVQRMGHLMREDDLDADARDAILEDTNQRFNAIRGAIASKAGREVNTRAPKPLTPLPDAGNYGVTANLNAVRMHHVQKFSGESGDPEEVYTWLEQCTGTAAANTLDAACSSLLLFTGATGSVASYISQLRSEGKSFVDKIGRASCRERV